MIVRLRAFLGGLVPSALGGAFFLTALSQVLDPSQRIGDSLVIGAIAGVAVVGLIRLFRVAPWGYAVAGVVCGPIPFLLLARSEPIREGDRFGVWLVGAFFGLVLGLLEWARVRRDAPGPRQP